MPRDVKEPVIPIGGINKDIGPGLIEPAQSPSANNVAVCSDRIGQRHGYANYGSNLALDSQVMGFHRFLKLDNTSYQFAFTFDHAYIWDSTHDSWQIITNGNLIENCEDAWVASANVTATLEATIIKRGAGSAKLVIDETGGFTTGIAAYENFTSVDVRGEDALHVWVYSTLALDAADASIRLSEANGAGSAFRDIDLPAIAAGTWTRCIVDDAMTDLNAVLSVAFIVNTAKGDNTVYIDDVRTVKKFTGDEDNWFDSMTFPMVGGEKVFFCNNADQVYQWAGDEAAEATLTALSNSPINYCKALGVYLEYLILLGTDESATRLRWCSTGDASNWTTGRSGFQDLVDDSSSILGGAQVGRTFVIFKEESIINMQFISSSPYVATVSYSIFSFETIMSGLGAIGGSTIQLIPGGACMFLASDYGVYTYNGVVVTPVTNNRIRKWIKDNISTQYKHRSFAIVNSDESEYYLWIPTEGSTTPNKLLVYNYINGIWWEGDISATAAGLFYPFSTSTWGAQADTWNTIDTATRWLDASGETGRRVHLFGDTSGNVKHYGADIDDSGTAITSDYQTKDFRFNTAHQRERVIQLRFEAIGNSVDVMYSTDAGSTWNNQTSVTLTARYAEYKFYLNTSPEKIRFRFYNNTAAETWAVRWYQVTTIPRKR